MDNVKIKRVVSILESDASSIKKLAEISNREIFSFFRYADLTGLDLRGQDLTGLNFDHADLRFSKVGSARFDAGAFNLSYLDKSQAWLKDEFEFLFEDLISFPSEEILIFARIRPELVDLALQVLRINFVKFAGFANVSANALRKARNNGVVAIETARAILIKLNDLIPSCVVHSAYLHDKVSKQLRQPIIQFLSGGNNGKFSHISRRKLEHLLILRKLKVQRSLETGDTSYANYRDTPEYLEQFEGHVEL